MLGLMDQILRWMGCGHSLMEDSLAMTISLGVPVMAVMTEGITISYSPDRIYGIV